MVYSVYRTIPLLIFLFGNLADAQSPGEKALLQEPEIQRIEQLQPAGPSQGLQGVFKNYTALGAIGDLTDQVKHRLTEQLTACQGKCPVKEQEYAVLLKYIANYEAVRDSAPSIGKVLTERDSHPPSQMELENARRANDPWQNRNAAVGQVFDAIDPYCRAVAGWPQREDPAWRHFNATPQQDQRYKQCWQSFGETENTPGGDWRDKEMNIVHAHRVALATCNGKYNPAENQFEQQAYNNCMNTYDPLEEACSKYRALLNKIGPCIATAPTPEDLEGLKTLH